jgi:hypothetical protein
MPTRARRQRSLILDLLRRFEPEIARAFAESVQDLRAGVDLAALERALAAGNIEGVILALRLDPAAFTRLGSAIEAAYGAAGAETAASISRLVDPRQNRRLFVRFDLRNPRAERWVREHSSTRIVEIVRDQREAVRVIVEAGVRLGDNPRRTALDIVGRINRATGRREGGTLGLTSTQAQWVANAREELLSGDPTLLRRYLARERRDKRFDRSILKAIREGEPVPRDVARSAADRYSDRMLQLRGETVARTETLSSMQAAKDEAFRQAVEAGEVSREQITKVWNATGDNRTRDSHADMDGQEVPLDQPFVTPSGARLMYPTDSSLGAPAEETIQCRCYLEHRIDFFAGVT